MKIFETAQMQELDRLTILNEPIDSIDLMERASHCFTDTFVSYYPFIQRVHIFAGPGNNGGDALAIARLLAGKGYHINCYLINPRHRLSPDCETNRQRLLTIPYIDFIEINENLPELFINNKNDLVIDGLFGSGLNKPLDGMAAGLVEYLNSTGAEIVSIDLPSGLFGEDNRLNNSETIIKASRTFTFQSPKLSFLLPDTGSYAGNWEAIDIGLSPEGLNATDTPYYYTTHDDIRSVLIKRDKFAYKNQFGHALIIAGSRGKAGAAVLSAKACLRSGAGLVTTYLPSVTELVVQTTVPEAMTIADPNKEHITSFPTLSVYTAIGMGPGLGTHNDTVKVVADVLIKYGKPMVLDADALNILAKHKEMWEHIPTGSILTPHIGEFERLVGKSQSGYERLQKARELACTLQSVIVLKGAYTAVCSPDNRVWFNSTGNPGMATAGSGDVLTGIITGLLAQGYSPSDAARAGVFLHGKAGDKATARRSQASIIAGDIIDEL